MKVLKCDICKNEFSDTSWRTRVPRYEIRFFGDNYPIGSLIDLCPECEEKLFEYLSGHKIEDQEVDE